MKDKIILFDFDGVIADSFGAAFEVNKMMCPQINEDDYRKRFEGNINDHEWPVHTDECRHDMDFFEEYVPKMKDVKMFPGMLDVIKDLSSFYTLIIVSSTITSPIREFMERHGATRYFAEIMGNDVHTSKVEKMNMILARYKATPDQCVFITDTLGDMREAARVGIKVIAVDWGFQNRETLERGSPLAIVRKPEELPNVISDYFRM